MSKMILFNRAWPNKNLRIHTAHGGVAFAVTDSDTNESMVFVLEAEHSALGALAILEAAGVDETDSPYMQEAVDNLRAYILIEEKVAAEARERAELEAEALELINAYRDSMGYTTCYWETVGESDRKNWLAVARKAREMSVEK